MTIKRIMFGLSALALSASLTPAAYAATDTGTLTVKAHIGAGCTLKTTNATMDFGNVTTTNSNIDVEAPIIVQCSQGQAYNIELGKGQNWNDSSKDRNMKNGTYLLTYNLFQDPARTIYWQEGNSPNLQGSLSATGDGNDQKYTIYGRIPKAKRAAPSGDYVDSVVITVGY